MNQINYGYFLEQLGEYNSKLLYIQKRKISEKQKNKPIDITVNTFLIIGALFFSIIIPLIGIPILLIALYSCYKIDLSDYEVEKEFDIFLNRVGLEKDSLFDARETLYTYFMDKYPRCEVNAMHRCKQSIKDEFTSIGERVSNLKNKKNVEQFFYKIAKIEHALLNDLDYFTNAEIA